MNTTTLTGTDTICPEGCSRFHYSIGLSEPPRQKLMHMKSYHLVARHYPFQHPCTYRHRHGVAQQGVPCSLSGI
eukprot:scaffold281224_cov19-Tisochrysis_lutea.AAC.2